MLNFYKGKTILVTGSTGFKGGWLCEWLNQLGAKVIGFGLPPISSPNLFHAINLDKRITQIYGDINISEELNIVCEKYKPEIIFHLAAQPLVKEGYKRPVYTFMTNAIGTVHILELVRQHKFIKGAVMITTDKVYKNKEWIYPYRETDRLGGHDPYSTSKAMAELAIKSYQLGFFPNSDKKIVSVRAGNVIGGGDWSEDRLIPNLIRSIDENKTLYINGKSVRPWQHVLEPLYGYLILGKKMFDDNKYIGPYNFGPNQSDNLKVEDIVKSSFNIIGKGNYKEYPKDNTNLHEARLLLLDNTKSKLLLGWYPKLSIEIALKMTYEWYNEFNKGSDMKNITLKQINNFMKK